MPSTPFQLPFDLASQQGAIDRKRAMVDALLKQSQNAPQGQMVSGHFIAPSFLSQLTPLLAGILAQKQSQEADKDSAALQGQYNQRLAEGLSKYFDTRQGKPGDVMTDQQAADLMRNDQAPQLADPIPADPRRAAIEALTSGLAPLQQLGQMDLQQLGRPSQNIKEAGGRFYDLSSGKPVDLGGAEYGDLITIDGDKYQRGPGGQLKKLDNAPKVVNTVSVGGDNKRMEGYGKALGESIAPGGKSYEAALSAQQGLASTAEAANAITQGANTGTTEPAVQWLRKFGESVGVPNAATAPTETLSSALKAQAFKSLGGLGNQISDADRKFVTEFTGDLSSNPQALKRMVAVIAAGQMRAQNMHNRRVAMTARKAADPGIEDEVGLPLNVTIPNDEIASMIDNIMTGKPSTSGAPTKAQPASAQPTKSNW